MKRVLVIGATGTVGSGVVKLLRETGHEVRAVTRRKSPPAPEKGLEWVRADLATGEGLRAAFEGAEAAFLMSPPGHADQHAILSPLIAEAAREAGEGALKKVVLMTALGANAVETAPMRRAEIELEKSGVPFNIVRPNWFMQNFNTFWVQGIREQGKILLPAGTAKTSFIDARDISEVVARLLVTHDRDGEAFDITGPEALDHDEVAREISRAMGRKITYEDIQPAVLKSGLLASGVPADYAEFLLMILGFLREGYNAGVTDGVKRVLSREPRRFAGYASDFKDRF